MKHNLFYCMFILVNRFRSYQRSHEDLNLISYISHTYDSYYMTQNILVYQNRTLNHRGWSFLPKQCAAVRTYLELKIEPLYRVQTSAVIIGATPLRHACDTLASFKRDCENCDNCEFRLWWNCNFANSPTCFWKGFAISK